MDDDLGLLRPAGAAAVGILPFSASGLFDHLVSELLLAAAAGLVLVIGSFIVEEIHERRLATRERRRQAVDGPPLRVRLKEWGDVLDVWTKSLLRLAGVLLIAGGGTGALGALGHKLLTA